VIVLPLHQVEYALVYQAFGVQPFHMVCHCSLATADSCEYTSSLANARLMAGRCGCSDVGVKAFFLCPTKI